MQDKKFGYDTLNSNFKLKDKLCFDQLVNGHS